MKQNFVNEEERLPTKEDEYNQWRREEIIRLSITTSSPLI